MKVFLLVFLLFSFDGFSAKNKELPKTDLKACLAAIYTAQRSFYSEHKTYAGNFTDIGFSNLQCGLQNFDLDYDDDFFLMTVFDNSGEVAGHVNSDREIEIY